MFHVILASHNRVAHTSQIISQLVTVFERERVAFSITLFDDRSTDHTKENVVRLYPDAQVLEGDGRAFWARGMATAEQAALSACRCSSRCWLLWLNDDVQIFENSFVDSIKRVTVQDEAIHVGAFKACASGELSYSGYRRYGLHPLSFKYLPPTTEPQAVDSFSGNMVFVPRDIAMAVGGINPEFPHALGDIDYGLRAKDLGIPIFLLPEFQGVCDPNSKSEKPLLAALREYFSIKGSGNLKGQTLFLRRHYRGIAALPIAWSLTMFVVRHFARSIRKFATSVGGSFSGN